MSGQISRVALDPASTETVFFQHISAVVRCDNCLDVGRCNTISTFCGRRLGGSPCSGPFPRETLKVAIEAGAGLRDRALFRVRIPAMEGIEADWRRSARGPHYSMFLAMLAIVALLPGCATAPLVQGGGLSSYDGLKPSDGKITKSRLHVKKEQLAAAKTINIAPTAFPPNVAPTLTNEQRVLVANA